MAHKLKPNLAFMGIDSLKKLIAQIESNANNSTNTEKIPELIKQLTTSINVAIKELDS